MSFFTLRPKERALLEMVTAHPAEAQQLRRAQALLWLDEGDSPEEIAERLRVTRQTVYNWATRFQQRRDLDLLTRLADAPRRGRPATVKGVIDPLIAEVMDQDPRRLGYRATTWTAPLLGQYLREVHHLAVCRRSVSMAWDRLEVCWKRPRHHRALRPATWRQAKGGCNAACASGSARSF